MPSIALDDIPMETLDSNDLGKPDTNINLLETNTTGEETDLQETNANRYCKNVWLPITGLLLLIIFFVPLLGLLKATQYHADLYPDVLVTPFPDFFSTNFTGHITQPCYYPVLTENYTQVDLVLCTDPQYPSNFYCPKDYTCLVDALAFPAPYVGCVSLNITCGDLVTCVDDITALPGPGGSDPTLGRILSLTTYSNAVISTFVIGGTFLVVLTCVAIVINIFLVRTKRDKCSKQVNSCVGLLLALSFIFIMVSGGFYFSFHIPQSNGDCYSNEDINHTLHKISGLDLGFIEVYVFAGCASIIFIYVGFVIVLGFYDKFKARGKAQSIRV